MRKIQVGHKANRNNLKKSGQLWLTGHFNFESINIPEKQRGVENLGLHAQKITGAKNELKSILKS